MEDIKRDPSQTYGEENYHIKYKNQPTNQTLDGINIRLDTEEENTSELEDIVIETIQNETQRQKIKERKQE